MSHPIKQLSRLTAKSKQIDGMGFGGIAPDNLEVAGALGMPDANTGKKLSREAYNFALYVYCNDSSYRRMVRASLLSQILHEDCGKITEPTLLKIALAAIREFISPYTKINNKTGEQEVVASSDREFAKSIGISHKSLTQRHEALHAKALEILHIWSGEAVKHINSHFEQKVA